MQVGLAVSCPCLLPELSSTDLRIRMWIFNNIHCFLTAHALLVYGQSSRVIILIINLKIYMITATLSMPYAYD